jgi:hypothetical protein
MPGFKPGDVVRRVGGISNSPGQREEGVILRIVRKPQTLGDLFTQYEVNFERGPIMLFEAQLAPALRFLDPEGIR